MKNSRKQWLAFLMALVLAFGAAGCSSGDASTADAPTQERTKRERRSESDASEEDATEEETSDFVLPDGDEISVAEIKEKYEAEDAFAIKPFYNVDQRTSFAFHFKSIVEPISAVTVHTDRKCHANSMLPLSDVEGYWADDGGVDVVVNPPVFPMLMDLSNHDRENNHTWGKAPVYYLCIRYDMESEEPVMLEEPVIIPFTVKSEVSVPTLSYEINDRGQFYLTWQPVEGAVSYNLYQSSRPIIHESSIEAEGYDAATKDKLYSYTASETGYEDQFPELLTSFDADTFTFMDFKLDGTNGVQTDDNGRVTTQNKGAGFYNFYLTAVDKDGNESLFSFPVESWKYKSQLPYANQSRLYDYMTIDLSELPQEAGVQMMEGDGFRYFPVSFLLKEMDAEKENVAIYTYRIAGTMFEGTVKVRSEDGQFPKFIRSEHDVPRGIYRVQNDIQLVPTNDISTIIDEDFEKHEAYKTEVTFDAERRMQEDEAAIIERAELDASRITFGGPYPPGKEPDFTEVYHVIPEGGNPFKKEGASSEVEDDGGARSLVKDQMESTVRQVTEADKQTVPRSAYTLFSESAEEEYIAHAIIGGMEDISVAAFPKLQEPGALMDTVMKVIYQNPYIMNVERIGYGAKKQMLHVRYALDTGDYRTRQAETDEAVSEIIEEIIDEDMSETERLMAIWTWMEDNTSYDTAALEEAEKNNFREIKGFEDSFNARGILCDKVGVCQSYALAFKLLSEAAGIECVTLTGYLNKTLPHAWNAVNLNGDWYWVDVTNHYNTSGIPYMLYLSSSEFATNIDYVTDDTYELDRNLDDVYSYDDSKDWYAEQGLMAQDEKEAVKLAAKVYADGGYNNSGVAYVKCRQQIDASEDSFQEALLRELVNAGVTEEQIMELRFDYVYGFLILM